MEITLPALPSNVVELLLRFAIAHTANTTQRAFYLEFIETFSDCNTAERIISMNKSNTPRLTDDEWHGLNDAIQLHSGRLVELNKHALVDHFIPEILDDLSHF